MNLPLTTKALTQSEDGIWYAGVNNPVSYPDGGHMNCFQVEDVSYWFRHRNKCIVAAVRRHRPRGPIVDLGGGNGFVAHGLEAAGFPTVLVEPGPEGALNARRRGLTNVVCATLEQAGFERGGVPAVGLFDVVEHVSRPEEFLHSVHEVVSPGGYLYITVPAYSFLWSGEDEDAGHFRRYNRATLAGLVEDAGFEVRLLTAIFRPLPIPIALMRALPYRLGLSRGSSKAQRTAADHGAAGGVFVSMLSALLESEVSNIESGRSMRMGGSLLLVAARGV